MDELQHCGVELVFLNRPLGKGPEDDLLLQVQGIVAEYERAKILERSRRGQVARGSAWSRQRDWRTHPMDTATFPRELPAATLVTKCAWPKRRSCRTSFGGWPASV